jgi:hemerythrin-like metal-binding protein
MRSADYPNFQAHKLEHVEMIAQVKEFLAAYDKDRGATVDKMGDFLKTWLVNHIRGSDQKYAPYMREKGIH